MTACPLCGGASEVAFVTRDRNRAVSDESFTYRRCARCASLFLENVPPDLGRYYTDDYFELPTLDGLREQARAEAYRIDLVKPHARGGRLVEIGPGHGVFALQAKDAGFETAGIEMDPGAVRYLREVVGIEAVESQAPEEALRAMPPSRVIALWHVLEHLPRPWETLAAAAENLEPGGVVVIATPNPQALGFRLLDGRWPHVDAPRHLFLIAFDALRDRSRALGLQVASVTATDPGGRHWNRFAWHRVLARPAPGALNALRYRVAEVAGGAIAAALGPVERRGRLGAAYTAVLVKP